jgi:diaminopimelate decarboxylase
MHHFSYVGGVLHAEGVSLARLAEEVGTPFYCYSTATLERHYRVLADAFADLDALICYAIKACSNQAVIKTLGALGAGMDVVSEGELRRARAAGVPADRIIFAGVGKTRAEMAYALGEGILGFNVESEPELDALSEVAASLGRTASIALRVNPDVDAKTHAKISTGKAENKFGVPFADAPRLYAKAAKLPGLKVAGVHMHIGSQITDLAPFRDAFSLMRELTLRLRKEGHDLRHLDIGGGLGVPYLSGNEVPPLPHEYARVVIYSKRGRDKTFTIVDAAMNDLIRPTLYEAEHEIWPVEEALRQKPLVVQDVAGPVCETGDYLALDRKLPPYAAGDLLAFMTAGAYGAAMSSTYNTRLLVPEVLVKGRDHAIVRPRQTYDDLIAQDRLPDWLS